MATNAELVAGLTSSDPTEIRNLLTALAGGETTDDLVNLQFVLKLFLQLDLLRTQGKGFALPTSDPASAGDLWASTGDVVVS